MLAWRNVRRSKNHSTTERFLFVEAVKITNTASNYSSSCMRKSVFFSLFVSDQTKPLLNIIQNKNTRSHERCGLCVCVFFNNSTELEFITKTTTTTTTTTTKHGFCNNTQSLKCFSYLLITYTTCSQLYF